MSGQARSGGMDVGANEAHRGSACTGTDDAALAVGPTHQRQKAEGWQASGTRMAGWSDAVIWGCVGKGVRLLLIRGSAQGVQPRTNPHGN